MRIFCGLTDVEDVVAAALVNERGGVIATAEITDDSHGYVALCRMWVRHSEPAAVSVADDGSTRVLTTLARAAGLHTTAADSDIGAGDEDPLDTAVHIARLLASGDLSVSAGGDVPPELRRLVLSVQALTHSTFSSQGALVELLRQCYPAALAAWDDPGDPVALELLRAVPDPAQAAAASPEQLAGELREIADPARVGRMASALIAQAAERDARPNPGVAQAIRYATEAVLAERRATSGLAESITDQLASGRKRKPSTMDPKAMPQPRRPEVSKPDVAPQPANIKPPIPPRAKPAAKPAEPLTVAMPPQQTPPHQSPPRPSALPKRGPDTRTPPHGLSRPPEPAPMTVPEPESGGFPLMPEPPEFVEPLTTNLRPPQSTPNGPDLLSAPASELPPELDTDDDLLIFSQARSAWFKGPAAIDDNDEWNTPVDEGWRAAAAANADTPAEETTGSGLPRRVPQANLVPGSAIFSDAPTTPIKRDASALARHTAGYFRGWGRARRETVGAGSR